MCVTVKNMSGLRGGGSEKGRIAASSPAVINFNLCPHWPQRTLISDWIEGVYYKLYVMTPQV